MPKAVPFRRHVQVALRALLLGALSWLCALLFVVLYAAPPLDRSALLLPQNILITDRFGGTLSRFYDEVDRSSVTGDRIPPLLRQAVVAMEDQRFFERRSCIDVRSVLRAVMHNMRSDDLQGGSTITQQLVRNLYLSPQQSLRRKVQEAWLACRLERTLSKEDILTLYLNRVSFGGAVEGVEQAAKRYFGVTASHLTVPQIAVLAALPQQPSSFSPGGQRERTVVAHDAVKRLRGGDMVVSDLTERDVRVGLLGRTVRTKLGPVYIPGRSDAVLSALAAQGYLTLPTVAAARLELRRLQLHHQDTPTVAPHFSARMKDEVERLLAGVERPEQWIRAGITVRTTIDPTLQRIAEEAVLKNLGAMHAQGGRDVAAVVLSRDTREVLAYVGNVETPENAATSAIDMAQVPRQPGSSIKPLLYAFAFERGFTPDSAVDDSPLSIGTDRPKNYEGGYKGRMTLRSALAQSRNIPAIRTFLALDDEDGFLASLAKAGAPTPKNAKAQALKTNRWFTFGWPLSIGSAEIPLMEMASAYATVADSGVAKGSVSVCEVMSREGSVLLVPPSAQSVRAYDTVAAQWTDDILRDIGARPAGLWRDILTGSQQNNAAKTGTSNLCLQRSFGGACLSYAAGTVWTLGYDERFVIGVLVGNADGSPMAPTADGLTVAAPIWRDILERVSENGSAPVACR